MLGVLPFPGHQRRVTGPVHATEGAELAQHVVRVRLEVFVERHGGAVLVGVVHHIHPAGAVGLLTRGAALQDDDVGSHFGAGILRKGVVRQADSPYQIGTLGDVLAGLVAVAVQEAVGYHHGQHATRAQGIDRAGEEVVVNAEPGQVFAVRVVQLLAAEWRVAHGHIKVTVRDRVLLVTHAGDLGVRVKRGRNAGGDAVQLHPMQGRGAAGILRHQAEEVAHTHRRLDHAPTGKAQARKRLPHAGHDLRAGVVRVAGRGGSRRILLGGKQGFQLCNLLLPALVRGAVGALECGRDPAPAHILGQRRLIGSGNRAAGGLQILEHPDSCHVVGKLGLVATLADRLGVDGEQIGGSVLRGYSGCG